MSWLRSVSIPLFRTLDYRIRRRTRVGLGLWLALLLLISIVQGLIRPEQEIRRLQREQKRLLEALRQAYAEQERLLIERRILQSPSGLVIEARRYGLGFPGEQRIVFEAEEGGNPHRGLCFDRGEAEDGRSLPPAPRTEEGT
jgi:hypothetical protein